ncbi:MAG TPA: hypothetical protein VNZ52_10640 [Candidatus Thermoplasmatota archaeon]|nr:hypothetical protein [Candidatus Thermoplasmatota archaeon]
MAAPLLALAAVAFLVAVHLLARKLGFLRAIPRSRWLSFAAGVPVAFVFLELLPALADDQAHVEATMGPLWGFVQHHLYLVALVGLALYYGVERVVKRSQGAVGKGGGGEGTAPGPFWVSITAFALLNLVIGYLLVQEEREPTALVLFTIAIALKFVLQDRALADDHPQTYRRQGQWVVLGAFVAGAAVAFFTDVPHLFVGAFRAFLAGGIILNVIKEELPAERESRWGAFLAGAALYAALVLAI